MDVREKLVELLLQEDGVCEPSDCKYCGVKGSCGYYRTADRLIANGVTVQEHGYWETVVEVRDNTACGNGVKIEYKRCSCCKNPAKFLENDFCGNCGAKLDLPEPAEGE